MGQTNLGTLAYELAIKKGGSWTSGTKAATDDLDKFGKAAEAADAKVDQIGKTGGLTGTQIGGGMVVAGAAMAGFGFAVGKALDGATDKTMAFGKEVVALQRMTGMGAEEASKFTAVFQRFGIEGKTVGMLLKGLGGAIIGQSEDLKKMGIATQDASGKNRDMMDVLADFADYYSKATDKTVANAMAAKLLGRNWQALLPVLSSGSGAIKKIGDDLEASGGVLSQADLDEIKKFAGVQKDNAAAMETFTRKVGLANIPLETFKTTMLAGIIDKLNEIDPKLTTTAVGIAQVAEYGGKAIGGTTSFLGSLYMASQLFVSGGMLAGIGTWAAGLLGVGGASTVAAAGTGALATGAGVAAAEVGVLGAEATVAAAGTGVVGTGAAVAAGQLTLFGAEATVAAAGTGAVGTGAAVAVEQLTLFGVEATVAGEAATAAVGTGMSTSIGASIASALSAVGGFVLSIPALAIGLAIALGAILGVAINGLLQMIPGYQEGWNKLLQPVFDFIDKAGPAIGEFFSGLGGKVMGWLGGVGAAISTGFGAAIKAIGPTIAKNFGEMWAFVKTAAVGSLLIILQAIGAIFTGDTAGLKSAIDGVAKNLAAPFITAWEQINSVFTTGWGALSGAFTAGWDAVKGAWDAFVPILKEIPAAFVQFISGIGPAIGAYLTEVASTISKWAADTWAGAVKGFQEGVASVIAWCVGLPEAIKGAVAGAGAWLTDTGKRIVDGLKQGFINQWNNLKSSISNLFRGLISWLRNLLGIKSPSAVFADIGKNLMLGLAGGIDKSAGAATSAMRNASSLVSSAFDASVSMQPLSLSYAGPGGLVGASSGGASGVTVQSGAVTMTFNGSVAPADAQNINNNVLAAFKMLAVEVARA